ncbi:bifunctional polysaccharide deacetylase/glycosyltransferase family 2 protein [Catenuloplanes atrovinosus]|uniref:Peptidoglycan/xylan/chitin deacetylase (PgdA/CDA1 family) n=1 Tax=Catenuloplanes atrovinosus TaxID=137266 RepID=A0AAE3YW32_9ACTN|nr:glycosyltransferase [Catenuloplanes atrovinosus]MDR7279414.1 peptidoglycan/xylan/chitin deacetylase (PgdA/CDA1 family) [Catenuloplanes atrovinosus]
MRRWLLLIGTLGLVVGLLLVNGVVTSAIARDDPAAPPGTALPPKRHLVLTFDGGPDPAFTPATLAVLAEHDVPAVFYLTGARIARHPGIARQIRDAGHEIGIDTATSRYALAGAADITSTLPRTAATRDSRDGDPAATLTDVRRAVMPLAGEGAIVRFHGGDRTAAALDAVIPELRRAGYTFTTLGALTGNDAVNPAATGAERAAGLGLVGVVQAAWTVAGWCTVALLLLGALLLARCALLIPAWRAARRRREGGYDRRVTVVVPVRDATARIADVLGALTAGTHPVDVVVVHDGSTDGTADLAERHPGATVLRGPRAGRAAALNTGIAHATTEVVVLTDGETIVGPDTVRDLVRPFADRAVGAVAGEAGLGARQRAYDALRCMTTVPAAAGAFRREALRQVDGLSDDTLAEDTDLTLAVVRAGWRVVHEPGARVTAARRRPVRALYGDMQAMWKHRRALIESGPGGRHGRRSLLALLLFHTLLPLLAPLIDLYLVYGLLFRDPVETVAVWLGALVLQLIGAPDGWREIVRRPLTYPLLVRASRHGRRRTRRARGLEALMGARLPTGSAATTARPAA